MIARTPGVIEQQVIALNGACTQGEVAARLNLALPTIRSICRRNGVTWIWQTRNQTGENNHNFQGGIGRSTIERTTRRVVIQSGRSLFVCERCTFKDDQEELPRHHKDRNRSNNEVDNIEVICKSCHMKEHNIDRKRNKRGRFVG